MKRIDPKEAGALLENQEELLIISHQSPDGDTVGSAAALFYALTAGGKRCRFLCADPIPKKFSFMTKQMEDAQEGVSFAGKPYIVAVDVADAKLMGAALEEYKGKVDLCLDHHISNTGYAAYLCLDEGAAAAAEVVYDVLLQMGCLIDGLMASCLYTAIATDTGCFRYESTTARTHLIASELIRLGAQSSEINQRMFETKSKGRVEIERQVFDRLEYCFDGRCAIISITQEMIRQAGVSEDELEGLASLPRQIEGVQCGVTMRQTKAEDGYKISVRTTKEIDASRICQALGGGGHIRASGCTVKGDLQAVQRQIMETIGRFLQPSGRAAEN